MKFLGARFVLVNREHVNELCFAKDDELSSHVAAVELLQGDYTFGESIVNNPYHTMIVRTTLSRQLPDLIPEIVDEFEATFKDEIQVGNSKNFISVTYSRLGTCA